MLRFMLGAAVSAVICYVLTSHPDLVHRGAEVAREQIAVASRNLSAKVSTAYSRNHDESVDASSEYEPQGDSITIDPSRARALVSELNGLPSGELWNAMNEPDFDRRAAAGAILLKRSGIPDSTRGVDEIKRRYFKSGRTDDLKSGFSYLGLLASQAVPADAIVHQTQRFVERYPQHEACDNAVWALGELGSDEMVPYLFQIASQPEKYGAAARERAFCCLAQCGRYSPAQRLAMVPGFIEVYQETDDAQTRAWSLQALTYCAPSARADSIRDWKNWWSRQARRGYVAERQ
jgi:hypothetical protein